MKECLPASFKDNKELAFLITQWKKYRDNADSRWSQTLPPMQDASMYKNYVHASDYTTDASPYSTETFNPDQVWIKDAAKAIDDLMKIGNDTYYPYIPGLSDSIMSTYEIVNGIFGYPPPAIGKLTAGVDCNGFVQESAAWENSPYAALPANSAYRRSPVYWTSADADIPASAMSRFHDASFASEITDVNAWEDGSPDDPDETIKVYDQLKYLVPGDVVWYSGHIMMVKNINTASGPDRRYVMGDVGLIESVFTSQGFYGCVAGRSINDLWFTANGNKTLRAWSVWRQK